MQDQLKLFKRMLPKVEILEVNENGLTYLNEEDKEKSVSKKDIENAFEVYDFSSDTLLDDCQEAGINVQSHKLLDFDIDVNQNDGKPVISFLYQINRKQIVVEIRM